MKSMIRKTARFFAGLLVLASIILFFSSGIAPPGEAGAVLRHNQKYDIDASPLFYSEVENMSELEIGIEDMRSLKRAKEKGRPK